MLAAASISAVAPVAAEAAPRTVFHGGQVFTGDPARPWAQAIAVESGRVVAVGSDAELLAPGAAPSTRIALGGRVVVPGFNDAHVHIVVPEGRNLNTTDFIPGPGPTLAEVKSLIRDAAAVAPAGSWLFAFIGTNIFDDESATRRELDKVSPDHPVALFGWTGHGIWINTKAMRTVGISETEPDPFGGHYRRFANSNVITGELHEYAEFELRRRMLAVTPDANLVAQYKAFQATAVQLGYTSLQDMSVGLSHQRALAALRAASPPLRVREICFPLTPKESCVIDGAGDTELVRGAGVKWITDGTPLERLSFVGTPYADRPDEVGAPDLPDGTLRGQFLAHRSGDVRRHQLLFHAVGDAAIDDILDAAEGAGGPQVWSSRRFRIEHGDLLQPGDRSRVKALGAVIVQNPTHFTLTAVFAERFVPSVFADLEPMQTLLAEGIPLAIGTDGIGAPQSPFLNIFLAMVHPTHPSEALTVAQAVTAFTRGSAFAEFEEARKGVLAVGQLADLVVLSQDIFHIAPPQIPATTSVLTMVGGKIVWDAGVMHPAH